MNKLKIGFDPLKNWDIELFRDVMRSLSIQPEAYELYIISTSEDVNKIAGIATLLNIPTDHVITDIETVTETTTALSANKIDIYLTAFMDVFSATQSGTLAIGILVNPQLQDQYQMNPKWFDQMTFWIKKLTINGQESC